MKGLLALWKRADRYAVAIAAVFVPLVYQPPGLALQGSALNWKLLATIVIAFIILARGKWFVRNSGPGMVVFLLLLGGALLLAYFYLAESWSCEVGQGRVIIGSLLKSDAAAVLVKTPSATCTDLLLNFASDPRRVYEEGALHFRELVLGTIYFAMIVVFSLGLLSLTRSTSTSAPP